MQIELKNATVIFQSMEPVYALQNVTLSVEKGEWISILGPSGSGKTTLLNVIAGLLPLTSGSIQVDGDDLSEYGQDELQEYRREKIGFIFQDYRLFDQFTVLENTMLPQWPYQPKKLIREKAEAVLERLGMGHRLHALPQELSGGEKQRAAIARAILHDPQILLCDEPTGNLDEGNRRNILQILKGLNDNGMTILFVTHDQEAAAYGSRTLTIRDGKLREGGEIGDLP
ncbi:ABC transporter ATP-binding protein [Caldibacillus debilis]|uniref:ABC-type antimicrobial peptide transport system, ATPase component n=1 Tax=Caldibacillus debilis GB1 TaxID=1339248 RepID=A0A420VBH5_9BACI|nr:ABC transporter ATP-binding protein [Caldibacillus debilis]RKO60876.1 ABC-type antimicrobial peptide transport system, ATPase component [Caldibacillus debilis GB1]